MKFLNAVIIGFFVLTLSLAKCEGDNSVRNYITGKMEEVDSSTQKPQYLRAQCERTPFYKQCVERLQCKKKMVFIALLAALLVPATITGVVALLKVSGAISEEKHIKTAAAVTSLIGGIALVCFLFSIIAGEDVPY